MSERLSPNAARLTCKSTDRMTASVRTTSMDRLTLNVLLSEIELPHRRPEMSAQHLVEDLIRRLRSVGDRIEIPW